MYPFYPIVSYHIVDWAHAGRSGFQALEWWRGERAGGATYHDVQGVRLYAAGDTCSGVAIYITVHTNHCDGCFGEGE